MMLSAEIRLTKGWEAKYFIKPEMAPSKKINFYMVEIYQHGRLQDVFHTTQLSFKTINEMIKSLKK